MSSCHHRHVLGVCTPVFILASVTQSLNWFDSWHWFNLFIMSLINLTLHPCHSQNSFISRCLTWKQWLIQPGECAGLKMHPNDNFCLGCWGKLKYSVGDVMRKRKNNHLSIFQGSCLWLCHSTHLLLLSSTRAGHLVPGFNETGYCHSHIWALCL